jgi:hypothetical protein
MGNWTLHFCVPKVHEKRDYRTSKTATHLAGINVLNPLGMLVHGVARQANHLDTARHPFSRQLGHPSQLRGAHWGKVVGVGEEDAPGLSLPA